VVFFFVSRWLSKADHSTSYIRLNRITLSDSYQKSEIISELYNTLLLYYGKRLGNFSQIILLTVGLQNNSV